MNIAELASRIQPAQENERPVLYIQITAHSPANHASAPIEQAFNQLCEELHAQGSIRLYSVTDDADSAV